MSRPLKGELLAVSAMVDREITRLQDELFKLGRMSEAPCFCCGYNGAGYFQPASHPCAKRHHALFHGDSTPKADAP